MKMTKLRIIHPLPSFICPFTYQEIPPLDVGQVVTLPTPVANLIIRKNRGREIKIENPFQRWEKSEEYK